MEPDARPVKGRDLVRKGPYARLWWSHLISSLGDWVTLFATFSLAARIAGGGRAASLGILVPLVARILPGIIIGVVGGVLADRWDRKRTMIVADLGRAVLVAVLVFVGNFRDLFILTFAIEVLSLVRQPAREAVIPGLVHGRHLAAANGLNLLAAYGTAPAGSAIFALLAQIGPGILSDLPSPGVVLAFALDSATFVASGLMILTIAIPATRLSEERRAAGRMDLKAPLRDMTDGFRFVVRYPAVRRMVGGMAFGLFGGGALFVLGQPFSGQTLGGGDTGYGVLVTSLGIGVGAGMAVVTAIGRKVIRREPVFAISLVMTGFAILLTALTDTVFGAAGWVFVAGLGTGIAYVTGFTHLHAVVTDDIRGRTFAALYASARGALLVSFGLAGVGAAALDGLLPGMLSSGIRMVILISGATILVSGGATLWAVRSQIAGEPMDDDAYRTLRDAGDAITWMRGDRRSKG